MENNQQTKEAWWKPAIAIFTNLTASIVAPILVALFLGKYLDDKFDSGNKFFFILIAIAFLVTIFSIATILKKYLKKMKDSVESGK